MQLHYRSDGKGILIIRRVGKSRQNARIKEIGHYSYSASLMKAESGNETPQFLAALSN
jgi:hypothetical protein